MSIACTKERFLDDVKDHEMTIEHDDGVHRCVKFSKPNSSCFYFRLTTWPGHLCFSGDMGCYVFSRLPDMFDFFRTPNGDLSINSCYWHEKLVSVSRFGGLVEWSRESFEEVVREYVSEHLEHKELGLRDAILLWSEVQDRVLWYASEEDRAMTAAMEFRHNDFEFSDFWENNCRTKTFHSIWSLYAIRWGIMKYQKAKQLADNNS